MRRRRWPWIVAALVLALPLVGALAAWLLVDADTLRPRLVAAVEERTGRRFTVGDLRLALSLTPTVELRDVALANAPGGSRPEMLTARRVTVQAALLPLLTRRVEISRIEVVEPDLLLETDAEGRGNWEFRPAEPAQPQQPAPDAAPQPGQPASARPALAVDRLRVERARLTWRDGQAGTAEVVELPELDAAAPLAGPATARGRVALRGQVVEFAAQTGAPSAFGGAEPWPFRGTLSVAGVEASGEGSLAADRSWSVQGQARAADLTRLARLLPDVPLPPLRDVTASGRATGEGRGLTSATQIALRVGQSDLSALRPGLSLGRFEATVARLDAPVLLAGEAALNGAPIRLSGQLGAPALLRERSRGPMPLDLRVETSGAAATLRGQVADPWAVSGVNLTLGAEAADLAALSPLAGTQLPPVRDLRASARVEERTARFEGGALLRDIAVTSSAGDLSGNLDLVVGERPGLSGRLASRRLDLDSLRAPQAAAPAPAAPQAPPARDGRVIPDVPLPVGALRTFDADLALSVEELVAGGQPWRQVAARIGVDAGRARLDPLTAETPAGPVTLQAEADARGEVPSIRLVARSPGLDLAALQAALGQPVRATGRAELDADLRGRGAGTRAVAATLGGHLGLAVLEGTLEPALTGPVIAALRERVPVLPQLPSRLPVDCVALRADAADGVARIGTLLLDAPAAKVAGSGTVNLGDETLALRMLHDVRAAGAVVRVAADLGGTLAAPRYGGVQAQNLGELLGGLAGRVGGDAGALLGALSQGGGNRRVEPLPDCGPALAAARRGREGRVPAARAPEPAPAAQAAPQQQPAPGVPRELQGPAGNLLRGLLGR
jgi:AsmA protein